MHVQIQHSLAQLQDLISTLAATCSYCFTLTKVGFKSYRHALTHLVTSTHAISHNDYHFVI